MADLSGKTVAILVDNYFEEAEFTGPLQALKDAGASVEVVAAEPEDGKVQSMNGDTDKSQQYDVDKTLEDANIDDYDAVVLPGGTVNGDKLRTQANALEWVQQFNQQGKPVAAVCHAPWVLVSANLVEGRKLASFPSLKDDIKNAGGEWLDQEVVIDGCLITSRNPDDIPAFSNAIIDMLAAT